MLLAHGLRSSNISILDAKTFYIPNLHYDGAGPDAYFWAGNGSEPNIMGIKVINWSLTYTQIYEIKVKCRKLLKFYAEQIVTQKVQKCVRKFYNIHTFIQISSN